MRKCKTKAMQADLGIFMNILIYSGIFRHRHNLDIIQNSGISKTLVLSEPETYSESWDI